MSGSECTAAASTATITAAVISLNAIVCTFFLFFKRGPFEDFFDRTDGVWQCRQYLSRQSHSIAHVGRLAGHDEAPARVAAHRGEHPEDVVRCQAVRVDDRGP